MTPSSDGRQPSVAHRALGGEDDALRLREFLSDSYPLAGSVAGFLQMRDAVGDRFARVVHAGELR